MYSRAGLDFSTKVNRRERPSLLPLARFITIDCREGGGGSWISIESVRPDSFRFILVCCACLGAIAIDLAAFYLLACESFSAVLSARGFWEGLSWCELTWFEYKGCSP